MTVKREESWGELVYDTSQHSFSRTQTDGKDAFPYARHPVVLNVDLTMKCNMDCMHCVTKDFDHMEDLVVSEKLIDWINKSPFMVVVITGGEPFLPQCENKLLTLLQDINNKGIVVDTNGTIFPGKPVIKGILDASALVRVSWDSTRPYDEIYFRHMKANTKQNQDVNLEYYHKKVKMIKRLSSLGVNVAVQSVVQLKNITSILNMPKALGRLSVKQWYIQRFIPSHRAIGKRFELSNVQYDQVTAELAERCNEMDIECIIKRDRRHNCVVLLIGDGLLFTQGEKPGQKVLLGAIGTEPVYFEYISSADHAKRYYG